MGTAITILVLFSFIGGVFASAPASQLLTVFVTNFPSNQQVTVTNFPQPPQPTVQTTAVDLMIFNDVQLCCPNVVKTDTLSVNFTAAFSFAPSKGFIQVNSVRLTINYRPDNIFAGS